MSLETKLTLLTQAIAGQIKPLKSNQGNLAALNTTNKTSLVNAINEVLASISSMAEIDDSALSTSTSKTYSASKFIALLNTAKNDVKNEILGGASTAYDTLLELQNFIQNNESSINGLLTAVGNRVRFDSSQTLTTPQQATACANIGVGNPEVDLVAIFNTALA